MSGDAGQPSRGRPSVGIRVATAADGPALAGLDHNTWAPDNSPGPCPPRDAEWTLPADRVVLVAERDGRVLGFVSLHPHDRIPSASHVLELNGLAVDPATRRAGVARALVTAALDEACRRGARRVTLRVLAPNAPARGLYASCGFVVEGVLREHFRIDGRYVDDVLMARSLD